MIWLTNRLLPRTLLPCTMLLVFFLLQPSLGAQDKLANFFDQNCVKCHGAERKQGGVRLDKPLGDLFADQELLETIASVLEAGEMPPHDAPQPKAETVDLAFLARR